jgi:hypothetical protein
MNDRSIQPFRLSPVQRIILTSLAAGVLDALGAILIFQVNPDPLFKFIASGAFGKDAFSRGPDMMWYGVAFHFFIATAWTCFYFAIARWMKLYRYPLFLMIISFGIFIWMAMNLIVLPFFSRISPGPFDFLRALKGTLILILAVAFPIVFSANQYYRSKFSSRLDLK